MPLFVPQVLMSFGLPVENLETNVSMTGRHVKSVYVPGIYLSSTLLTLHVTVSLKTVGKEWRQMKRAAKIRTEQAVAEHAELFSSLL